MRILTVSLINYVFALKSQNKHGLCNFIDLMTFTIFRIEQLHECLIYKSKSRIDMVFRPVERDITTTRK